MLLGLMEMMEGILLRFHMLLLMIMEAAIWSLTAVPQIRQLMVLPLIIPLGVLNLVQMEAGEVQEQGVTVLLLKLDLLEVLEVLDIRIV